MKIPTGEDQFHKNLIDNLYDGVYFVDTERMISYWNNGAERITGYPARDLVGKFCYNNILDHVTDNGHHLCTEGCPLLATIHDGKPREAEVYLRHAEGHRVPVQVRTSPIYDNQNKIIGAVEVFSNINSLVKMKRRVGELELDVFHDTLTGISNRKLLEIKIKSALQEYQQHKMPFGLLFLDIDHFKKVNDTYGHTEGDRVLMNTAQNMMTHLRNSDLCGRWGGEEFIAIVYNVDTEKLARISEKLRVMIANSIISVHGENVSVTASIGATLVNVSDTMESLIERADHLMYQSKQNGRNCVTLDHLG